MFRFAIVSCVVLALATLAGLSDGLSLILAYFVAHADLALRPDEDRK